MEAKEGVSNLEKLVDEFQQEEDAKERRREQKRLKKKQKRASKARSQAIPTSCCPSAIDREHEEGVSDYSVSSGDYRAVNGSCSISHAESTCSCCDEDQGEDDSVCDCCPCESVPLRLVDHCPLAVDDQAERNSLVDGWLRDQSHDAILTEEGQLPRDDDGEDFVSQLALESRVNRIV